MAHATKSSWTSQGPETFDTGRSAGSTRKIAWSAITVVVVLGIGVAVWALFIRGGQGQNPTAAPSPAASQKSEPVPTTKPLPEPPPAKDKPKSNAAALVEPPGKERKGGGEFDLDELRGKGLLAKSVVAAVENAGMTKGLLLASQQDKTTIGLYSIAVSSQKSAAAVAQEYAIVQQEGSLPAKRQLSMQGVPVFGTLDDDNAVLRAVYVLYHRVIIVDVYGSDGNVVKSTFKQLLEEQVSHAPPTKRDT